MSRSVQQKALPMSHSCLPPRYRRRRRRRRPPPPPTPPHHHHHHHSLTFHSAPEEIIKLRRPSCYASHRLALL